MTTAGDGGKFSSRRGAPCGPSAVHVGSVYAGRGKCFRIPQVGIGCRRRWKRCQNLKRNASVFLPPLPLARRIHPFRPSLAPFSAPRFVMLIVSNSGHHRYVYFPFSSPSFLPSARHILTGLGRAQSLVFVLGY